MIKNFEYKIPLELKKSYELILESGNELANWELVSSNEQAGIIEWKQKFWLGLAISRIKVYLKEPRPQNTLVTIYISPPLQIFDPANMCERIYKKLELKLNNTTAHHL